jgi:hypothetical protein
MGAPTAIVLRPDATGVAAYARHAGVQIGLVLEKVEVAPRFALGIVGRAVRRAAAGADEAAAGCEVDLHIEPTGLGVEVAAHYGPGRRQAERLLHQSCIAHGEVSALARADLAWQRARRRQGRYAPRKRAVAFRPSLTRLRAMPWGLSGRDEETATFSRTKKHDEVGSPGYPSKRGP